MYARSEASVGGYCSYTHVAYQGDECSGRPRRLRRLRPMFQLEVAYQYDLPWFLGPLSAARRVNQSCRLAVQAVPNLEKMVLRGRG